MPQHLELEDVVAWSLSAVDLLCVFAGAVVGWWTFLELPGPTAVRVVIALLAVLAGVLLGVVRIGTLPLRAWIARGLAFVIRARVLTTGDR